MTGRPQVGVVGAGWAGLAAAVELADAGCSVTLWDMAPQAGGRARSGIHMQRDDGRPVELDCGQHILIGAYTTTLALMRHVGVDLDQGLLRQPLQLVDAQGQGLRLPPGHPIAALVHGIWNHRRWPARHRLALLATLARWRLQGMRCPPTLTVRASCAHLPAAVVEEFIDPLCVAALNTPPETASAQALMRVLHDGLLAGRGGSDLLLPRRPLDELWPKPALEHLRARGVRLHLGQRVQALQPMGQGAWRVDEQPVDRLVLATSAREAARLLAPWDADWTAIANALAFEPIVTTWVEVGSARLPGPMISLQGAAAGPAQFAFDLAAPDHPGHGLWALVSSAAAAGLDRGLAALEQAVLQQAQTVLRLGEGAGAGAGAGTGLPSAAPAPIRVLRSVAERRATFRCEAGLTRPAPRAATGHGGVFVAGDYVDGPYPATLEGAMRSGVAAAQQVKNSSSNIGFRDAKSRHARFP